MSLRQRRLLFILFIVLFIIIVPAVLLYATGQQINWRRFEFEKTSAIIIDSEPRDAMITLNGAPVSSSFVIPFGKPTLTKAKISSLAPGDYVVGLEKEGFWPWNEQITLDPGEAANAGTVRLFRKTEPELISSDARIAQRAEFSPNKRRLLLFAHDALTAIDIETGKREFSFSVPFNPETDPVRWSPDHEAVIIGTRLLDFSDGDMVNIGAATGRAAHQARWDSRDSNVAYYLDGMKLYRFVVSERSSQLISDLSPFIKERSFIDYYIEGARLYIVAAETATRQTLLFASLPQTAEGEIALPSGRYRFETHEGTGKPRLFEESKRTIYLIEEPVPLLRRFRISNAAEEVAATTWVGSDLVYSTPFELRLWDGGSGRSELLTRIGTPIIAIKPLPIDGYLAYATDTGITIFNYRIDPFANPLDIVSTTSLRALDVGPDGSMLYFYGQYNGQAGLFRVAI